MRRLLSKQDGAAAVEFAILAPLVFVILFGVIAFGLAFLQLGEARSAVREGARYAAVSDGKSKHHTTAEVQKVTVDASTGLIANSSQVVVSPSTGCGAPGTQVTVTYDTTNANGGNGIVAQLIFFQVPMNQVVTSQFMCEG